MPWVRLFISSFPHPLIHSFTHLFILPARRTSTPISTPTLSPQHPLPSLSFNAPSPSNPTRTQSSPLAHSSSDHTHTPPYPLSPQPPTPRKSSGSGISHCLLCPSDKYCLLFFAQFSNLTDEMKTVMASSSPAQTSSLVGSEGVGVCGMMRPGSDSAVRGSADQTRAIEERSL